MPIPKRFEKIFEEGSTLTTYKAIFVDQETGVQYLFVQSGYGGGLTPLLDAYGKPLIASAQDRMEE